MRPELAGLPAAAFVRAVAAGSRGVISLPAGDAAGPTVQAEVNHGRWIVRCPWCNGAEGADRADRYFYCLGCQNVLAGGKRVPVRFPSAANELETLLARRPGEASRNWLPGQTLDEIRAENLEHGIGIG